jgi:hypothetical protein
MEKTKKTEEARGTQENRERKRRKSQSQERKKNNPRKEEEKRETTWTSLRARSVEDKVAFRKLHN